MSSPLLATYHPQYLDVSPALVSVLEVPIKAIIQHCYFVSDFVDLSSNLNTVLWGITWSRIKWLRRHCANLGALILPMHPLLAQSAAATLASCVPHQAQCCFRTFALGVAFAWNILPARVYTARGWLLHVLPRGLSSTLGVSSAVTPTHAFLCCRTLLCQGSQVPQDLVSFWPSLL